MHDVYQWWIKNFFQSLMTEYLQNFEFTFENGSSFGKTLADFLLKSAEKVKNFTFFFTDLFTNYVRVIVPSFNMTSIVLEWNEIIHQKFRHFSTFSWFYSAKVLVCKTDWNIKRANVGRKINSFYFFLYGVIDQLHRRNSAKFQVIWSCRISFTPIYWKYLKIQLNS